MGDRVSGVRTVYMEQKPGGERQHPTTLSQNLSHSALGPSLAYIDHQQSLPLLFYSLLLALYVAKLGCLIFGTFSWDFPPPPLIFASFSFLQCTVYRYTSVPFSSVLQLQYSQYNWVSKIWMLKPLVAFISNSLILYTYVQWFTYVRVKCLVAVEYDMINFDCFFITVDWTIWEMLIRTNSGNASVCFTWKCWCLFLVIGYSKRKGNWWRNEWIFFTVTFDLWNGHFRK
jgi:hypothetical protein